MPLFLGLDFPAGFKSEHFSIDKMILDLYAAAAVRVGRHFADINDINREYIIILWTDILNDSHMKQ